MSATRKFEATLAGRLTATSPNLTRLRSIAACETCRRLGCLSALYEASPQSPRIPCEGCAALIVKACQKACQ
mgnify:FL=1